MGKQVDTWKGHRIPGGESGSVPYLGAGVVSDLGQGSGGVGVHSAGGRSHQQGVCGWWFAVSSDAYAARDVLDHHAMRSQMTPQQEQELVAVLAASGLGTRNLSVVHMDALTAAVHKAEDRLRNLLVQTGLSASPPTGRRRNSYRVNR